MTAPAVATPPVDQFTGAAPAVPKLAIDFKQGDPKWHALRKRALTDLYWFADVVLGYGDRIPMRVRTHLLLCKFIERKTGSPALDTKRYRKAEMPRETGKTTLITQAYAIQRVCRNPDISIMIANEKEQTAKDILAAIKYEFETNALLRALFPEIIPDDLNDTTWSSARIVVKRSTGRKEPTIFVIGVGGTVTGMHPDVILVDDMISREAMENARGGAWQIMYQVNRWINQLDPLVKKDGIDPEITFIGTRWWHKDSYEHIDVAFGNGEAPRTVLLRIKLEDGTVQQVAAYSQGDLAIFRRAAIEDGRSIFPEKWTLEDLAKIRVRDAALFACLPPGEQILTYAGPKAIETIGSGDVVFTKEGRWRSVITSAGRRYRGTMVRLTTWGQANAISLTANHKVWSQPARKRAGAWQTPTTEYDWTPAGNLRPGDVLPIPLDMTELSCTGLFGDADFWFLVGHFIGDGTINKAGAVAHCFDKRHRALAERIAGIIQRLFGRKARIEEQRTTLRITYRHPRSAEFFREVSRRHGQKWLPRSYEQWSLHCQGALVDGYWSADGCVAANGHRVAVSVCAPWLYQLQRILARLGSVAHMSRPRSNTTRIEGRVVTAQPVYQLWVYAYKGDRRRKAWIENGVMYRRVRKVEHVEYDGPVFNCEVTEDHSYVSASNAISYANCNYMNNPTDEITSTFKESWLKPITWLDDTSFHITTETAERKVIRLEDLDRLLIIDPGGFAERLIEDRARASVIAVGDDFRGHKFFLDCYSEQDTYLVAIRQAVDLARRYGPRKIYVERAGQQVAFAQLLRLALIEAGLAITVDDSTLKPGNTAKDVRILEMEPYYQGGQFYVGVGPGFLEFRQQYSQFPRAMRKDVLDVLGYWPRLMRKGSAASSERPEVRQARERAIARERMSSLRRGR